MPSQIELVRVLLATAAEDTVVAIPSPSAEPTPTVALAGALGAVLTAGGARGSLGPGGTGTDGVNRHTPA